MALKEAGHDAEGVLVHEDVDVLLGVRLDVSVDEGDKVAVGEAVAVLEAVLVGLTVLVGVSDRDVDVVAVEDRVDVGVSEEVGLLLGVSLLLSDADAETEAVAVRLGVVVRGTSCRSMGANTTPRNVVPGAAIAMVDTMPLAVM